MTASFLSSCGSRCMAGMEAERRHPTLGEKKKKGKKRNSTASLSQTRDEAWFNSVNIIWSQRQNWKCQIGCWWWWVWHFWWQWIQSDEPCASDMNGIREKGSFPWLYFIGNDPKPINAPMKVLQTLVCFGLCSSFGPFLLFSSIYWPNYLKEHFCLFVHSIFRL